MEFSSLAQHQRIDDLQHRAVHQVGQRLGVDAQRQHGGGKGTEHDPLARVEVFELGHLGIGDLAKDDALDQPQRVGGAQDQRGTRPG